MASKFTITAELNLQTKNLSQVVNNLKQQFQGADLNIKIKDLAKAEASLRNISSGAKDASASMGMLGGSINQAFRRFTVVTLATGTIVGFTRALKNAVSDAIEFERELVKIAQATGQSVAQLRGLATEVGNVSSSFGVSSKELILAARSLTQAGFAADKVTGSLKILAQTELAATFDSISNTTEGAIALLNQFGKQAQKTGSEVAFLEKSFSAINQVSKEFAVESSDLVTAVRTTGAAFEAAGGNLNELLALFTSVRSTTRESAESISTGFRTIFTRIQRVDTINNLKALGIQLQDVEGKFVGPMEATKRLSMALSTIDPRDFRFNLIVEELGGFRQVSKVIPLIQQFATTQKALNVAQGSSGSLAKDAQTAQLSLAVQISKTREEFLRFIRDLTETESFQGTVRTLLNMANAFIKVADTIKPLIPLLGAFAALRIGQSIIPAIASVAGGKNRKAEGGVIHKFARGGLVPGEGNGDTVPAMLTPGEFVIKKSSVKKLGVDNLARANKYAGGGKIEKLKGSVSNTVVNELTGAGAGQTQTKIGLEEDRYSTSGKIGQETLSIIAAPEKSKVPKYLDLKTAGYKFVIQDKSASMVQGVQNNEIKTLLQNNKASADLWEVLVHRIYGGKLRREAGFPVDITDITTGSFNLRDAKYKPYNTEKEEDGVSKTLNYDLYEAFKDNGYAYTSQSTLNFQKGAVPKFLNQAITRKVDSFGSTNKFAFTYPQLNFSKNDLNKADLNFDNIVSESNQEKIKSNEEAYVKTRESLSQSLRDERQLKQERGTTPLTDAQQKEYDKREKSRVELRKKIKSYKQSLIRLNSSQARPNKLEKLRPHAGITKSYLNDVSPYSSFKEGEGDESVQNFTTGGFVKLYPAKPSPSRKSTYQGVEINEDMWDASFDVADPRAYDYFVRSIQGPDSQKPNLKKYAEKQGKTYEQLFNLLQTQNAQWFEDRVHDEIGGILAGGNNYYVDILDANKTVMGDVDVKDTKKRESSSEFAAKAYNHARWKFANKIGPDPKTLKELSISSVTTHPNDPIFKESLKQAAQNLTVNKPKAGTQEKLEAMGLSTPTTTQLGQVITGATFKDRATEYQGYRLANLTEKGEMPQTSAIATNKAAQNATGMLASVLYDKLIQDYKDEGEEKTKIDVGQVNKVSLLKASNLSPIFNAILGTGPENKVGKYSILTEQQVKAIKDAFKARMGRIGFASGGAAEGTDTVPAMLTPGEYVINKKSAQAIGYGNLNRMNKVGKFANGGPVQMFNDGTTGQGVVDPYSAFRPKATSSGPTIDVLSSALEQSAKTIGQGADKVTNKFGDISDQLLLFGPTITGAISQMGMFDKATADMVSATTFTFSTIKGVGGNLTQQVGKYFNLKEDSKAFKALNAGVTAYALSQSAAALSVQYFGQTVESEGKKFASFVESLTNGPGASKDAMTQALTEQFKAASRVQTRQSGIVKAAGAIGTAIGTVGGGAAGAAIGGASSVGIGAAPGAAIGASVGGTAVGTIAEEATAYIMYNQSLKKVTEQANALSSAMYSATESNREFQKFFQNIDKESPEKIAQQSAKLAAAYKLQSDELSKFNSKDLASASDSVKQQFQAVSEAAKLTAKNLQSIIGTQLQQAVKRSGQLVSEGYMPDNEKIIQPTLDAIRNKVTAEYEPKIRQARTEDERQGIKAERDSQITLEQSEARKVLEQATKQQLEMTKALVLENNIRKDLIGSMQKQLAISAAIERTAYELDRVSKTVAHVDSVFSGSLTGLKSSYDPAAIKMKSPDQGRLDNALAPVREIGPAGKDLSDNILNINKVMPNLEAKLLEFSKATDTASGSLFDVSSFIKNAFNIDPNSLVGKTLVNIIESTTRGTGGGTNSVNASSTSLRNEDVRKKIVDTFEKFGETFRTQAGGIIENLAQAEQEGRAIAEKINESRQKQLELALQGIDTFSQYIEAVSKARGRDMTLMEKNTIRNMKQYSLAGTMGNNSAAIGQRLTRIYADLNKGGLSLEESANLNAQAKNLTKALEGLANQSDKTSDVLQEIDKIKKNRENLRELGREFGTGTAEDKDKMQQDMAAAMTVAQTGSYDSIPEEMRKGADAMLERFKDIPAFKQAQNRAIADTFMKAGNPLAAQMVMQETSAPEEMLIHELGNIFSQQIAAQQKLSIIEGQRQAFLIAAQQENSDVIKRMSVLLENLIQQFQADAEAKRIAREGLPTGQDPMGALGLEQGAPADWGLHTGNAQMNAEGQWINAQNGAAVQEMPTDAKAKIDTESMESLNQNIQHMDTNVLEIDATIGKVNDYLTRLRENLVLLDKVFEAQKKKNELLFTDAQQAQAPSADTPARGAVMGSAPSSMNGIPDFNANGGLIYRADGGSIFQPKGTDTVPAMLTPGEFVIKKSSVDKIGVDTLSQINAGGYAAGGLVSYLQLGGMGGGAKFLEQNAPKEYKKKIEELEKRVTALEKENDALAKLLKIFGFGDVKREGQNNNGQMANQAQPINNPIQNMMMMGRGPVGGTSRSKARRNAAMRREDTEADKQDKLMNEAFGDLPIPAPPSGRNFKTQEQKAKEEAERNKRIEDQAELSTLLNPEDKDYKAQKDIAKGYKEEKDRAELAKKRVAEASAAERAKRDQQGNAPAPAEQKGKKVRPANSIYSQAQWDEMQKKADQEKELAASRVAEKKASLAGTMQTHTKDGYRSSTAEEVQAHQLKKYGQRPEHISEEKWLDQIAKAEETQDSSFFEGVKKKGVKSKLSDYGKAPTSPYTEKTQEALDKAKALSAAADAHREKEFGNKPGQPYKSEGDIPVLRPSQVGELVTPNSLKETQAQASQPAIPSHGVKLTPAEELANQTVAKQPDQYVNQGSLPDYLNAKGRILANQAVANRVNEAQMQAGVANPESRAESFANSFATKSKEMMSPIAPVTIPNKLTELESLKKKNPLSMFADGGYVGYFGRGGRARARARTRMRQRLMPPPTPPAVATPVAPQQEAATTATAAAATAPSTLSKLMDRAGDLVDVPPQQAAATTATAATATTPPAKPLTTADSYPPPAVAVPVPLQQASATTSTAATATPQTPVQTPQQRLREVNAKIDLMTGTREVLPTTQDPYAPPIGVTSTGKGETGPRGLEGANQLQALDQERQELMASRESAKIGPQQVSEFRKNEQARIDAKYAEKSANVDKEISDINAQGLAIGQKKMAEAMNPANDRQNTPELLAEMKKAESIGVNSNPAEYTYGEAVDKKMADLKAKYDAESAKALDADNGELASQLGKQYTKDRMALESQSEEGYSKVKGTGEGVDAEGNTIDTTYGVFDGIKMPAHEAQKRMNQRVTAALIEKNKNPVNEHGNAIEGNMLSRGFGHLAKSTTETYLKPKIGKVMDAIPGLMPTQEGVNKKVDDAAKEPMTEKELADVRHSIRMDQLSRGQLGSTAAHNTLLQQAQKELNAFDSNTGLGDYYPEDAPVSKTKTISEEEKRKRQDDLDKDHRAANPYNANGGLISYLANGGSPKGSDTVPAMLTPGEFVMKKDAVDKHGTDFMEKLNSGGVVPGFADGGIVSYFNRGASVGIRNQTMELSNRWKSMMANNPSMQQINGARNNAQGQMQASVDNTRSQMQGSINNTYAQMGMSPAAGMGGGGGGAAQQGGGGGGQPGGMPNMSEVTTALNNMSTAFTGFTDKLNALATAFSGLTITHNIVFGGQINVGGVDGPTIVKALEGYVNTQVTNAIAGLRGENGQAPSKISPVAKQPGQ